MELLGIIIYALFGVFLIVYFIVLTWGALIWTGDWRAITYASPAIVGIAIEYHVFTELVAVGIK